MTPAERDLLWQDEVEMLECIEQGCGGDDDFVLTLLHRLAAARAELTHAVSCMDRSCKRCNALAESLHPVAESETK